MLIRALVFDGRPTYDEPRTDNEGFFSFPFVKQNYQRLLLFRLRGNRYFSTCIALSIYVPSLLRAIYSTVIPY